MAEVLVFGHIVAQHIKVDDDKTYVETYLWSCQTDAVAGCECFKHVGHERRKLGIFGGDVLRLFAKHGLTVSIYR